MWAASEINQNALQLLFIIIYLYISHHNSRAWSTICPVRLGNFISENLKVTTKFARMLLYVHWPSQSLQALSHGQRKKYTIPINSLRILTGRRLRLVDYVSVAEVEGEQQTQLMGGAGIELWITRCQVQDSVVQPPSFYNNVVYNPYQMGLLSLCSFKMNKRSFWFFNWIFLLISFMVYFMNFFYILYKLEFFIGISAAEKTHISTLEKLQQISCVCLRSSN